MQWSKLKKHFETFLADAVKDRVQFYSTAYGTGDSISKSRAWITWDKQEIANFSTAKWWQRREELAHQIRAINKTTNWRNPEHREGYYQAREEAYDIAEREGFFSRWDFNHALHSYLELSIEDATQSHDPIVRALSMFDRRLGKRRLRRMRLEDTEHPLVKQFYQLRCEAEGIGTPEVGNVNSA